MRIYNLYRSYFKDLPELPDPRKVDISTWTPDDPVAAIHAIDSRNLWHRIPQPIRIRLRRLEYEEKKKRIDAEDDRRAALRGPPTNCRVELGAFVTWDPPDIEGGESPECYFVEAERDGEWTTFQPPIYPWEKRRRVLYRGTRAVRVAAYYPNEPQRLGWGYRRSATIIL